MYERIKGHLVAKKKPSKKRGGKKPPENRYATLVPFFLTAGIIGVALLSAPALIRDGGSALEKLVSATGAGFVTGLFGNIGGAGMISAAVSPGMRDILGRDFAFEPSYPYGLIPVKYFSLWIPFLATAGAAIFTLAYRKVRVFPILSMAAGGAAGVWISSLAKAQAPLFNDMFAWFASNRPVESIVYFLVLVVTILRMIDREEHIPRHWALAVPAGLVTGFWTGYIGGGEWLWMLIVLVYFVYRFILNENVPATVTAMPVVTAAIMIARGAIIRDGLIMPVHAAGYGLPSPATGAVHAPAADIMLVSLCAVSFVLAFAAAEFLLATASERTRNILMSSFYAAFTGGLLFFAMFPAAG